MAIMHAKRRSVPSSYRAQKLLFGLQLLGRIDFGFISDDKEIKNILVSRRGKKKVRDVFFASGVSFFFFLKEGFSHGGSQQLPGKALGLSSPG